LRLKKDRRKLMRGIRQIGTMALVVGFMGTGLISPVEAGVWPFASKKHIKKQVDPLTGRVNELEEINRQQERRIKEVDEKAQEGIRSAMSKTEEADAKAQMADQKATEANKSALQANSNAKDAETRMQSRLSNIDNYQVAKTMQVNFKLNQ